MIKSKRAQIVIIGIEMEQIIPISNPLPVVQAPESGADAERSL